MQLAYKLFCIPLMFLAITGAVLCWAQSYSYVDGTAAPTPMQGMSGATGSIGGGALLASGCTSGTVTISGATVGAAVLVTPNTYPGDGAVFFGYVSSANTVTVKVCVLLALTPTASTYNVRVIQ